MATVSCCCGTPTCRGGISPAAGWSRARRRKRPRDAKPTLLGLYLQKHAATNRDHVAVYVGRQHREVKRFSPNGEIAEIGWFSFDALPDGMNPGTARRIAEIAAENGKVASRW